MNTNIGAYGLIKGDTRILDYGSFLPQVILTYTLNPNL